MSPRLDGARKASLSHWLALTLFILQKSRMRRRARTDLCGGRSAMGVPTATITPCSGLANVTHGLRPPYFMVAIEVFVVIACLFIVLAATRKKA